jgi:hypothetical protein
MGSSKIAKDIAAIEKCWPDDIVEEFARDESYFHEIRQRLEWDLRKIRGASLVWQTQEAESSGGTVWVSKPFRSWRICAPRSLRFSESIASGYWTSLFWTSPSQSSKPMRKSSWKDRYAYGTHFSFVESDRSLRSSCIIIGRVA